MDYLINYPWPGNIRELENALEHAAVFCKENVILPENLPSQITQKSRLIKDTDVADLSLAEMELDHIQRILELTNGHRAKAAKILQISETTLYRKLHSLKQREAPDNP